MSRRGLLLGFLLVVGACTTDSAPTSTDGAPATTSTTLSPRLGLVPSPGAITAAQNGREITRLDADLLMAFAMFSSADLVPIEFLESTAELGSPVPWDHTAVSRLIGVWDQLDGQRRVELGRTIDGLADLVGPGQPAVGTGCIPVRAAPVQVCVGDSVAGAANTDLEIASGIVRPWVHDAITVAWPVFELLFGTRPAFVGFFLSDLDASGSFLYRGGEDGDEECLGYVDVFMEGETDGAVVSIGDDEVPDGVPLMERVQGTVVHQLFHCFARSAFPQAVGPAVEGAATWSEDYVFPDRNTELAWLERWISDPAQPYEQRLQDTAFAFLYADRYGAGPQAVIDVLESNSIARLDSDFEEFWHAISVASWNQEPVDVLIDDGVVVPGVVDDVGAIRIGPEAEGSLGYDVEMFSRDIQTFEFSATADGILDDFARLRLDLSAVPDDIRITAIPETVDGWIDPVPLTGAEWQFCRRAVGQCNDADPSTILPYTRIVLISTNVDNGRETFEIGWDTYNPRLSGAWVRTQGPVSTVESSPYSIIGVGLYFDEVGLTMLEDTEGYSLTSAPSGYECTFAGAYSIGADPEYGRPSSGDVSGTVTLTGPSAGEPFTNVCVLDDLPAPGLHVPIADEGATFGFEIRGYDTLWIYAFERFYVYSRVEGTG